MCLDSVGGVISAASRPRARISTRLQASANWSASELAYAVPAGHAVIRLATVEGEHAPPLLVELSG